MKIDKFEDLKVWSEARGLVKDIYSLTASSKLNKDFGLKEQIQRSAVSILPNISEGFERENNREFVLFLKYAKGSAGELRAQLYLVRDLDYINENQFSQAYKKIVTISKLLSGFMTYLKSQLS
ncbi:MAG: four helix bundle protein [Elusimicrobia bacterium]|nr:four helix bundle protein [Elusimicrobiota bacterium]